MALNQQLQTNNKTFFGRHWSEHAVLRRYKPSDHGLTILSVGCSTGEELLTLRTLFPAATLFGCDIDWHNLQAARSRLGAQACVFHSSDVDIQRHGPYDLIVCNSVLLRHTETVHGRKQGIAPAQWTHAVSILDGALKPGGILQIINSNIPFRFHPVASGYRPLRSPLIYGPNFVDQYDLNGEHLCTGVGGTGWSAVLTRHLGETGWRTLQWTDLQDVHFQKNGGEAATPVEDEIIPNLPAGDSWASGNMSYRPQLTPDPRPSTHVEVDVTWSTIGVDNLRLNRTSRRIWFDGSVAATSSTVVDLTGASASSFIEAATGKRSSRLALDELSQAQLIRSPSF